MVSPCSGGGPATAIPGSGTTVVITAAAIESTLILLGFPEVAAILAPVLAGVTFDLTQLCSNDPPADPMLTGATVLAAIDFSNPAAQAAATATVYQWFKSWYWYKACVCVTGATPAPPALSNPGNPVSTNTGLPYAVQANACWDVTNQFQLAANSGSANYSATMLPQLPTLGVTNAEIVAHPQPAPLIPGGITSITVSFTVPETQVNFDTFCDLQFYTDAGVEVAGDLYCDKTHANQSINTTATGPVPATATHWLLRVGTIDTVPHFVTVRVSFLCTGGSATLQQACCPPDPVLSQQVTQILQLVQSLYAATPVPLTSYAEGATHAGLTLNGSQSLAADVIAIKVAITTDYAALGAQAGTPTYLFNRGWLTPTGVEGPLAEPSRLVYATQVFSLPVLTSGVDYSITPGVTISITELTAGP